MLEVSYEEAPTLEARPYDAPAMRIVPDHLCATELPRATRSVCHRARDVEGSGRRPSIETVRICPTGAD